MKNAICVYNENIVLCFENSIFIVYDNLSQFFEIANFLNSGDQIIKDYYSYSSQFKISNISNTDSKVLTNH